MNAKFVVLSWCLLLAAPAGATGRLLVSPEANASGSCAPAEAFAEELRRVLPQVEVVVDGAASGEDQRVRLLRTETGWRVEVQRADTSVALSRDIEGSADSCETVASTASLIVERHLLDVDWPGTRVEFAPPAQVSAPAPLSRAESSAPAPPPSPPSLLQTVTVSIGPGVRVTTPTGVSATGALEVAARLRPRWRLTLTVLMSQTTEAAVVVDERERGVLSGLPASVLGGAGLCTGSPDGFSLCGGGSAGATALFTSVEGQLYRKTSATLWLPAAALWAHAAQPMGPLELSVTLRVLAPLGVASVTVEGTSSELGMAPVEASAVAAVGWRFF
ncbi:MAG: hypothetical protein WBV82_00780 [Myxococcaceae bacterium]